MRSRPASGQVRAGGGVLRLPPAARGSTRARRGAVSPRGARAPLGAALGAKACGDAEQAEPGPTGVRPPPPPAPAAPPPPPPPLRPLSQQQLLLPEG
jgi:hypothetical protein